MPNTLETIGRFSFYGCSGLTSISLPNSLTSIEFCAFGSCPIKQVNFEGNDTYKWVNNVGQGHLLSTSDEWDYQTSPVGCLVYGNIDMSKATDLSEIKANLFGNCAGITSINLPNSIKWIYQSAFYNCTGLTSIDLSKCTSLASITNGAFQNCTELTSISLPNSLTNIAFDSFQDDSKINEVFLNFNAAQIESLPSVFNEDWLSNAVGSDKMSNVTVYVPQKELHTYLIPDNQTKLGINGCKIVSNTNATSWISGKNVLGDLIYTLENSNISPISIDNLIATDPTINSTIQIDETISYPINEIKSTYFRNNINLSGTLTIDKGITKIEANAFNGCENISGIKLTWTQDQTLSLDPNWLGDTLNKSSTEIIVPFDQYDWYKQMLAISNCTIVGRINNNSWFPKTNIQLDLEIKNNEKKILNIVSINSKLDVSNPIIFNKIDLNDNAEWTIEGLGKELFKDQTGLKGNLIINDGIISIGESAFANCNNLSGSLTIPSSIQTINANAFNGCKFTDIYLSWKSTYPYLNSTWLGDLNNSNTKIHVPSDQYNWYVSNKDTLGINNCTIINPDPVDPTPDTPKTNLPLILGLSLGLGVPILAIGITQTILFSKATRKSKK